MTSTDISFINTINRITMLWLNSQNPPFFLPMAKHIIEINRQTLLKQIGESVCNKGKSTLCSRKQSTLHTFSFAVRSAYIPQVHSHGPLWCTSESFFWPTCSSSTPYRMWRIILDRNLQGNRLLISFARLFGVLVGQSHKHNDEDGSWGGRGTRHLNVGGKKKEKKRTVFWDNCCF